MYGIELQEEISSAIDRQNRDVVEAINKVWATADKMEKEGWSLNSRGVFDLLREKLGKIGVNIRLRKTGSVGYLTANGVFVEQMTAPEAPVLARLPYKNIEFGFMRHESGRIFFLGTKGSWTVPFPVLEDGTVSREAALEHFPAWPEGFDKEVELIHPRDLGINEIRWVP